MTPPRLTDERIAERYGLYAKADGADLGPPRGDGEDVVKVRDFEALRDGSVKVVGLLNDELDAIRSERVKLVEGLRKAEAALADIGDSAGKPRNGWYGLPWCEDRAFRALEPLRTLLSSIDDKESGK